MATDFESVVSFEHPNTDLENERRILIIGNTGNGKSASANTIFREKVFESRASTQSVTKKSQFHNMTYKDKQYLLVDTPALFSPITDQYSMRELAKVIAITYPGFHIMIVVVKVGRFTEQEKNAFAHIEKIFGSEIFKSIIILFTGLDNLEADGMLFRDYVSNHIRSELKHIVFKCDGRVVGFNNRADERIRNPQIQELLDKIEGVFHSNQAKRPICDTIGPEPKRFFEREIQQRQNLNRSKSKAEIQNEIRRAIQKDDEHDLNTNHMLTDLAHALSMNIEQTHNRSYWECVTHYLNCVIL